MDKAEIPEVSLHNFAYSQCLKVWRTLEEQTKFIAGDRFELGQVVILGFARNVHCHLSQGANAVGIAAIIGRVHFMSADAIIDHLLLISQISQIGANYGSKRFVFSYCLSGSRESGNYKNQRSEETGAEYSKVRHGSAL